MDSRNSFVLVFTFGMIGFLFFIFIFAGMTFIFWGMYEIECGGACALLYIVFGIFLAASVPGYFILSMIYDELKEKKER